MVEASRPVKVNLDVPGDSGYGRALSRAHSEVDNGAGHAGPAGGERGL